MEKNEKVNEPKVVVGIPVGTACARTEVDFRPFIDCLQALATGNRFNLAGRVGVLAYRLVVGDGLDMRHPEGRGD